MKKMISCMLTLTLLLSVSAIAFADLSTGQNAGAQLKLIGTNFALLRQPDSADPWYYSVTDLDHNGRLELLACKADSATNNAQVRGWEITPDGQSLNALHTPFENEMSDAAFFNIMTDSADTYYDVERDAWFYVFKNYNHEELKELNIKLDMVFTCGMSMMNGMLYDGTLATMITTTSGGKADTSIMDSDENPITDDEFMDIAGTTFAGCPHSSTSFDWFSSSEASELSRLADSYAVFSGDRTDVQDTRNLTSINNTSSIVVTKNPANEQRYVGETALFVVNATGYNTLTWTLVSSEGQVYNIQDIRSVVPDVDIRGENTTSLTIAELSQEMNGWGVYCTFSNSKQSMRTTTANISVYAQNAGTNTDANEYYNRYGLTDDELFELALTDLVMSDEDWSLVSDMSYYDSLDPSDWNQFDWDSYLETIW